MIKLKTTFDVTQEIVTPESAEYGDAYERGFVSRDNRLRDALDDLFGTRTQQVEGVMAIEPDSSPTARPRWLTVYNGPEFLTGAQESRSLHIPPGITAASARRIARLIFKTGGHPCPNFPR